MPSQYILAAYETYAKTYQKWNKIPIEWDLKNKKLRCNSLSHLIIWEFDICCAFIIVSMIAGLILQQLISRDENVPLSVLFANGTSFIVMIAAISVYINMVLNGRSFVTGYNQLLTLESNLEALEENSHAAGRLKPEPDNDLFVKALKPCTLFCYPSALVVTCVAVFLKIDPGYLFFHQTRVFLGYANDSAWTTEMIVGFLRSSVFFLALMETGRVWPLACMVHISYKMMISNCIGVMHRITQRIHECGISKIKNVALLKMVLYQQNNLNLVMGLGGSLDQTALFIQLQMTVICGIVTNFATLRFYDSLPFVIYHKMPFISLLLALCTNAMLKYCHVIADNSTDLRILLTKVTGWNGRRGYFSRKVAAIRGLRIYGGVGHVQILWIERGTKAKFFDFILNQTIDLLLAIPRGVKIYKSKAGKRAKSKLAVAL